MRDSRGKLLLVHGTITDNHNLIEYFGVFFKFHINDSAALDCDFLRHIADVGEFKMTV